MSLRMAATSTALHPIAALGKALIVLAMLALVAACGRYPAGPIHGDNDPHPGVARARSLPIQGIDIARYQGNVDFERARLGGTRFVFIKATEGADYVDPMFNENWRKARNAGVPRAAYHFFFWCRTAAEQAAWFVANVPNDPDALPPVLDLEWNNHSSCKYKPSPEDAREKVAVMLAAMEAHTGKLPIIYTDMTFHRDVLAGYDVPATFWLRSVAAEPHERYHNRMYTFWQWTQTGVMAGIRGEVDRNAFYGSENEWTNFLLTGCDPRALSVYGPQGRCRGMK
jgi:lysozyme